MRSGPSVARLAVATAIVAAGVAAAAPVPTQPGPPTVPPGPETTAPTTTQAAPTAAGPPALSGLRLARMVVGQQGHARFLVGVRVSTPATVALQVIAPRKGVVKTVTSDPAHPAGRVYLLVDATDGKGFQLRQGRYRVSVRATDPQGRASGRATGAFRLELTPPRGLLDLLTVPMWPSIARGLQADPTGQLVAAVAPGGVAVKAGIRRGDIIVGVNGRPVASPGAYASVVRSLTARVTIPIQFLRAGQPVTVQLAPLPDWTRAPDYRASMQVAVTRSPGVLAYAYAQARQLVDAGKPDRALAAMAAWPPEWRDSAPGQLLAGKIAAGRGDQQTALSAYNAAARADPVMAAAQFGRGLALSTLGRVASSATAFTRASRIDPADATAPAFESYTLLRADQLPQAQAAAEQAISLDSTYEDGYIARGLALLGEGQKVEGVRSLKQGLALLGDPVRAKQLIGANLEPNVP